MLALPAGTWPRESSPMPKPRVRRLMDKSGEARQLLAESAVELAAEQGLTACAAAARRSGWRLVSIEHRGLVSKGLAVNPDAALYP